MRHRPGDRVVLGNLVPAFVHPGHDVENPDLGQRAVHGREILGADPEIGAERPRQRIHRPLVGQHADIVADLVGPQSFSAHAMLAPALHRAAAARALVLLAGPFVVALRYLVEHPRADHRLVALDLAAAQQVMGDRREAEAGAGRLVALIEDRHAIRAIRVDWNAQRHLDQRRRIHPIAKIHPVGNDAAVMRTTVRRGLGRWGHRLGSSGTLGCAALPAAQVKFACASRGGKVATKSRQIQSLTFS